jgi:hypothetical protein
VKSLRNHVAVVKKLEKIFFVGKTQIKIQSIHDFRYFRSLYCCYGCYMRELVELIQCGKREYMICELHRYVSLS